MICSIPLDSIHLFSPVTHTGYTKSHLRLSPRDRRLMAADLLVSNLTVGMQHLRRKQVFALTTDHRLAALAGSQGDIVGAEVAQPSAKPEASDGIRNDLDKINGWLIAHTANGSARGGEDLGLGHLLVHVGFDRALGASQPGAVRV